MLSMGGNVEISALCAHPAFKGAGQLLLVAALVHLMSRPHHGVQHVALQPDNRGLRDKYKAIGFQPLKQGDPKKLYMSGTALSHVATEQGAQKMLQPWSRCRGASNRTTRTRPKRQP